MEQQDNELWKIAKKRVAFKKHLATYIIMNTFFWALWLFSKGFNGIEFHGMPWPVWPGLGWGIGLAFNYFSAYHGENKHSVEKEYEKLKREK